MCSRTNPTGPETTLFSLNFSRCKILGAAAEGHQRRVILQSSESRSPVVPLTLCFVVLTV